MFANAFANEFANAFANKNELASVFANAFANGFANAFANENEFASVFANAFANGFANTFANNLSIFLPSQALPMIHFSQVQNGSFFHSHPGPLLDTLWLEVLLPGPMGHDHGVW